MKKTLLLLSAPVIMLFAKCGSGTGDGNDENDSVQVVDLGTIADMDLSKYGYPLIVNVPAPSPNTPEATVDVLDWGGIEIRVGTNFQIQISGGEGDVAQKKSDIQNEDINESTFLIDEADAIFYRSKVKGTEIAPEYHFFVVKKDGNKYFEIEDIKGEVYEESAAKRMFDIARAIKIKPTA